MMLRESARGKPEPYLENSDTRDFLDTLLEQLAVIGFAGICPSKAITFQSMNEQIQVRFRMNPSEMNESLENKRDLSWRDCCPR